MSNWMAYYLFALALLSLCIVLWPTQWISDRQNRWLRIAAVGIVLIQVVADGPKWGLTGAYAVAALFLVLFIPRGADSSEPSSVRESKEGSGKKLTRWTMVIVSAAAIASSIAWLYFTQTSK